MQKSQSFATAESVAALEAVVTMSASAAAKALNELLIRESPLGVLRRLKFESVGRDPLSDRPLNLIEQVNQTFTYLATFEAVKYLFRIHPASAPFTVNLGTASGPDISSSDGSVVAEVFAAVTPNNNQKLSKDLKKLSKVAAAHRYVFYSCIGHAAAELPPHKRYPGVTIVSLGMCGPQ